MERIFRYLSAARLPLALTALFIVQNLAFNAWVHLSPNPELPSLLFESFTLGIFLYGPAVLLGPRSRYLFLFCVSIAVSLVFVSQYIYYSFFGGFLQASALHYAGQLNSEWSTVATLLSARIILFTLNVAAVPIAAFLPRKGRFPRVRLDKREKIVASVVGGSMVLLGYGALLASSGNGWQKLTHPAQTVRELNSFTFSPDQTVQEIGILNYSIGDMIGALSRATAVTPSDVQFVRSTLASKPAVTTGRYFGIARGDNLIFVQVESLDASVIGQTVGGQEITPNLNRLAREGLYFDDYYTQVGPGNTADAEFVTLDSLYPLANTVAFIDFAHDTYAALPDLLVRNGYHTYALHGDVPNFWNRANMYPSLGYEDQISKSSFTATETGFETLPDDDFLSQSAQKLAAAQDPFMATVITLSSHTPFIIPEQYQALQFTDDSGFTSKQEDYLQSIHYADGALGAFIAELKSNGVYDRSLIAIYGDHGSSTYVGGILGGSRTLATLDNSRVPLILLSRALNAKKHGSVSTPGSHLDLYPTVANLLGIKPPSTVFGQDLLSTKTPVVAHRDPYSGQVTAILTSRLAYEGAPSGRFEDGSCTSLPASTTLPVSDCQSLFDRQSAAIRASDLIIRGNLLPQLQP